MAVPSRPLVVGVFRFVLVSLLAFVLLVGTAFLVAHGLAWIQETEWTSPRSLAVGFVCGIIFWLFVATFHLRPETQTLPFAHRDQFLAKAKSVLQEMGYALASQRGNTLSFRPQFSAYLFGGSIHLTLAARDAKLAGPKLSLELFRRCFRLLNHVQRVQLYLQEHRKFTDNVIKRVELQLLVRPEQLEAVHANVIDVLQKEGEVACELNVLFQSETGIRENTLEFQIREWLDHQRIPNEIHKDHVQFVEVAHPDLEAVAH